ncbi:MAG: YebC/PmpR family DNA-binding transcriptional regulator [Pelagibacterales bacterium]|nr:YebC/PmpR family DNA-binding transcriptional regulator [Pelagibacterales bacterium]
MAGHSQFANIKHRKGAQDAKRAKLFTKILREITVAAKSGQPDPNFNPRLRNAMIEARTNNMPKDRVDAAIKKVISGSEGDNFEEIRYEGYAPNGIAIIVEALTDNRNRTASEVRSIFTKSGGSLGETGSVGFMFNRVGVIQFDSKVASDDEMFEAALEFGASEVESSSEIHVVITDPESFSVVRDSLIEKFGDSLSAKLDWKAINSMEISDLEQAQKLLKMIDALEDCDDVQMVTGNYVFAESIVNLL